MLAQVFGFKPRDAAVPVATPAHKILTLDLGGVAGMDFVVIQPGTFAMGSPDNERGRSQDEGPQHQVTISKPFYMGRYQVTQSQWQEVMSTDPSVFKGCSNPVENISWHDCQEFFRRLSAQVRKIVRLPTEAEWEYACRAGSKGRFCDGDDDGCLDTFAWYYDPNIAGTHPVGQKRPNPWGLYDMHGNVCEWCEDWYDARYYEDSILTDPRGP
jgi:formylglycine-generating enzyme required for sulfatase activity